MNTQDRARAVFNTVDAAEARLRKAAVASMKGEAPARELLLVVEDLKRAKAELRKMMEPERGTHPDL